MTARLPNLFLVGAPRCGTSALHVYLAAHPDVFMSPFKEPHYFSTDLTEEGDRHHGRMEHGPFRTPEQYAWLYRDVAGEAVRGESSVMYLYSRTAAERIAAHDPAAKILIMLREPVEFLRSYHARLLFEGDEDRETLAEALALEAERAEGRSLPATVRVPSLLQYGAVAAFAEQIERYRRCFPAEQIKVIVFDDFRADTEGVYRDVLRFLGVDHTLPLPTELEPRNAATRERSRLLGRALRSLNYSVAIQYKRRGFPHAPGMYRPWLARVLPAKALWIGYRTLAWWNAKPAVTPPLDDATRAALRERFRPEVERLGELLGRDLGALWGYREMASGPEASK